MLRNTHLYLLFIVTLIAFEGIAQGMIPKTENDSLYREDQFYFGVTYNIVTSLPSSVTNLGLSGGLQIGFLRDMPINKQRNMAIAIGAGLSFDQYGKNLLITKDSSGDTTFSVIENSDEVKYNRLYAFVIEAPLEFRWRNSTPQTYKFWRVYGGIRAGYAFHQKTSYKNQGIAIKTKDIPEFEKLRLGATLSVGYSTFNFYAYYSINSLFKDNTVTDMGEAVDFRPIKLGLILYIL